MQTWTRLGHGWCLQSQNSSWGTDAWLHNLVCRQSFCLHQDELGDVCWDLAVRNSRCVQEPSKYYKRSSDGMTAMNIDLNSPEHLCRLNPESWSLRLFVVLTDKLMDYFMMHRSEYWTQQSRGQHWLLNDGHGNPVGRGIERYKVLSVKVKHKYKYLCN